MTSVDSATRESPRRRAALGDGGRVPKPPARCGTYSGNSAHYRRGEKPCQPCRDARNAHARAYRHRRGLNEPRTPMRHGTSQARAAHYRAGERLCLDCAWTLAPRIARIIADPACGTPKAVRRHRARGETCEPCRVNGATGRTPTEPHGTPSALRRHEYHREPPCDPCREVQRRIRRERHARERARRQQAAA